MAASGGAVLWVSRLPGHLDPCSSFPTHLLCSLQFLTMMNGPDLPGPSWRFVPTEPIAKRKAPLSYLPSGNWPSPPQPPPSPSRTQLCGPRLHLYSVSIQYPCRVTFGCHIVPALLQVFQMYPTLHPTDLKFTRSFLSLYLSQNWGGGEGREGGFTGLVVAF